MTYFLSSESDCNSFSVAKDIDCQFSVNYNNFCLLYDGLISFFLNLRIYHQETYCVLFVINSVFTKEKFENNYMA